MPVKTTVREHLPPDRMATIKTEQAQKQKQKTSIEEDVETLEPLYTVGGNAKWCSYCGKQCRASSKIKKHNYLIILQPHIWLFIQKNGSQRVSAF